MTGSDRREALTPQQAARVARLTPSRLARAIEKGVLKAFRTVGGHRRIRRGDLEAFLKASDGRRAGARGANGNGKRRRR